eukprot:scaffold517_cov255-Pinguiococcus_pyrenoidosus.AAC.13
MAFCQSIAFLPTHGYFVFPAKWLERGDLLAASVWRETEGGVPDGSERGRVEVSTTFPSD